VQPASVVLAVDDKHLVVRLAVGARPGELDGKVRRAKHEATPSYRVTIELAAENHWPRVSARAWAVSQRAHHAHQRARERHPERHRASGAER
jgi:hypothetical protein